MHWRNTMHVWPMQNDPETTFGGLRRSELMARVKSRGNATTELKLVTMLRANGLTGWRRHTKAIGQPDFVWPKTKIAIFVDGCFWHGHGCSRNLSPKTNIDLWQAKFERNRRRDRAVTH